MSSYYEKILATGEVKCIEEEIPFEIPKGWEWTRIGNIFNHTSGKQQSSSNKSGGTPQKFITTSNLYWGYFVLDNVKVMNFTDEEIKNCSATKGDLLVCEGGAGYGRSAIWNEDYDICLQNHVHRLRPCINGICEYVYYFIYLLKESNNLASVGTAMPGLSANRLKGLLLPLPPINEQKRIVSKMEELIPLINRYAKAQQSLDELNQNINEKIKKSCLQEAIQGWPNCLKLSTLLSNPKDVSVENLLERIKEEKQRLVKEGKLKKSALNDSIIFKGDDNKYYEKIGKKIVCIEDEVPFEIPNSWVWARLGAIVDFSKSQTISSSMLDMDSWILDLEDIEKDSGRLLQKKRMKELLSKSDKHLFYKGNVLYSKLRPYLNKVIVADEDGACTTEILAFDFGHIYNKYAQAYLMSPFFVDYANSDSYGIKMPRLGSKKGNNALFPIPPLREQQRIVEKIEQLMQLLK